MSATPFITLNNGRKIPQIGLGTWQIRGDSMKNIIKTAIDLGYRHFDAAPAYGNEDTVGKAVNEKIAEGVIKREDIFITTKLWITEHKPDKIVAACKRSLRSFGLDYVDLYLVHWPLSYNGNCDLKYVNEQNDHDNTTLEQKWEKMEECVRLGLAKSIGISNFNSEQVDTILKFAKIKPVINQVEAHPYLNQKKLISFCKERDVVITAYSPLGSPGSPEGNLFAEKIPNTLEEPIVKELAEKYKKSPAQIILRYMLQLGVVIVPKAFESKFLKENLSIVEFSLAPEDVAIMDSLNQNLRTFSFKTGQYHKYYPFHIEF